MKTTQPQGFFDVLVFVGRFQPYHRGHQAVIEAALERASHVLVLVGSSNAARSPRNPFAYDERQRMIVDSIGEMSIERTSPIPTNARIIVRPLNDHLYNDAAWMAEIQRHVDDVLANAIPPSASTPRVGIIGHAKDNSSYYLTVFPRFEAVDVPGWAGDDRRLLSGTAIRDRLFAQLSGEHGGDAARQLVLDDVPRAAQAQIRQIAATAPFATVAAEWRFAREYRAAWSNAPFPPTFMTVDTVVQQSGHVLMVVRKDFPGQGMLALPGGFVKQDETLLEGALRELNEETQIDVPRRVLIGARRAERTFDDPYRSSRGRTITHAFRFDLSEKKLPKVKGADDAQDARWIPISHIRPEHCFEDHAFIIESMLGVA